ncbi:thioredoxin family protein [Parasphingorhabdus sp.]|uniref:thioredoxin family protein n=1 Tax=Parasphingorhabdus sp. TaxID=2709688 RepID=UPI0032658238
MRFILLALALMAIVPISAASAEPAKTYHPKATPYDREADSMAEVDAALARAQETDKRVVVVMGGNWCHDSRGLAFWFSRPRFAAMLDEKYEVVYVDVGQRDRNIDIAQRFGIESLKGTPTVLVLSSQGLLLNRESAPTWRNAASRTGKDIFLYFNRFTPET